MDHCGYSGYCDNFMYIDNFRLGILKFAAPAKP